jgi:large subunit ribosomal protein L9
MKVILNQTVPKLGKEGQVVTVADGYARNYLFPRKLATFAEKGQIKALEARRARMDAKLAETKAAAEALKEKLHGQGVKVEAKVGKEGAKLFGAVTAQDVADAIAKQLGVTLEKKQVGVLEPIKRLGRFDIEIDLHRDVDATVKLHVFDPAHPELDEVPAAEDAAPETVAEPELAVQVEEPVEA